MDGAQVLGACGLRGGGESSRGGGAPAMTLVSHVELGTLVADVGAAIKAIDSRLPQAANARTGALFQPGIGPHSEARTVELVVAELQVLFPDRYSRRLRTDVPYAGSSRQRCDLCIGALDEWEWVVEV